MSKEDFYYKAVHGDWPAAHPFPNDLEHWSEGDYALMLLDAEAWKAVGKVERWDVISYKKRIGTTSNSFRTKLITVSRKSSIKQGSIARMHRMIDALAEGRSIESYLQTL